MGLLCAALLVACPKSAAPPPSTCTHAAPLSTLVFGGARPVTLQVPKDDDPSCPLPLVVLLHGYGANGELQEAYFGLDRLVDGRRVLLAAPDGTQDSAGRQFWNATDACCNFDSSQVDDVAYLRGLIAEIGAAHAIDRRRVYVIGHSNGGFMAYRLACEHPEDFAAIVSLAGATFADSARCAPASPVSVLQIHGEADAVVLYDGGSGVVGRGGPAYPGAVRTTGIWAKYQGCSPETAPGESIDLGGDPAVVSRHTGCPPGVGVELWTLPGGSHTPSLSGSFTTNVWRWLEQHPKP
ncbi:MAG: CE1 family esterase [Myxococcaceae bacterium]